MPLKQLAACTFLSQSTNGQQYSNTFHLANPGLGVAPDLTSLTGLANDIDTYFRTTYLALLSTLDTFVTITVRQVPDPTIANDPYLEYSKTINATGTRTRTGNASPYSLTAVIQERTPVASRRYRGHMFAPPPLELASFTGNNLTTSGTYWTAIQAFIAKLATGTSPTATWTGTTLASYFLAVYSKAAAKTGPTASAYATVTGVTLNPAARWLRSRERGTT